MISPSTKTPIKKRRISARSPIDSKGKLVFEDIINEAEQDNISVELLQLAYGTIYQCPIEKVDTLLQRYGSKYEINFPQDYFNKEKDSEKRDQLFVYTLEVNTVYTPATITPSSTSTYINSLDPMLAYNEYFLIFNNGTMTYTDVMLRKPDDVKKELVHYCETQIL